MSGDAEGAESLIEERAPGYGWARRTVYGEGGVAGAAWRVGARPLGRAWEAVARRRLERPGATARPPAPAISVGNVTIGGGGKTSLVRWLLEGGLPVGTTAAVLSRGTGRAVGGVRVLRPGPADPREAGDEPALLARAGAWVGVSADRLAAARAVAELVRPDVFLLDDALQHRRIARALDLVTFTAGDLAAPARCLPAGPLRQGPGWRPPAAAWVVVGADPRARAYAPGTIGAAFAAWWSELPGTPADWEDAGTLALDAWREEREAAFDPGDRPVVAFAAVARPASVARFAAAAGYPPVRTAAWPDHHAYARRDVERLLAEHPDAAFVTTEKDAVKLDPDWFGDRPVGVLRRRLVPRDPALLAARVREGMGRD